MSKRNDFESNEQEQYYLEQYRKQLEEQELLEKDYYYTAYLGDECKNKDQTIKDLSDIIEKLKGKIAKFYIPRYSFLDDENQLLKQENEELKQEIAELEELINIGNNRQYRKKYIAEYQKDNPNIIPDFDEVYKEHFELKYRLENIQSGFKIGDKVFTIRYKGVEEAVVSGVHYSTKRNCLTLTYMAGIRGKSVYNTDMNKVFRTREEAQEVFDKQVKDKIKSIEQATYT